MGEIENKEPFINNAVENDKGELVDLYVPRKCHATGRLITPKDHTSVQLSVAQVDANGKMTDGREFIALSGDVRAMGEADDSINRLATERGRKSRFTPALYFSNDTLSPS